MSNNIEIGVRVNSEGAVKGLNNVGNKIEEVGTKASAKSSKGLNNLSNSFGKLGKSMGLPLDQVASKMGSVTQASSTLSAGIGGVATVAVGATLAIVALGVGLFKLAIDIAKTNDEIGKMSDKLRMTTDEYQKLKIALSETGVDMGTYITAQRQLTDVTEKAIDATTKEAQAFKALGVSIYDNDGKLKTNSQLMGESIDALNKYSDDANRAIVGTAILGRGYDDLRARINANIKVRDKEVRSTTQMIRASESLNDSMAGVGNQFGKILNDFMEPMVSVLAEIFEKFRDNSSAMDSYSFVAQDLGNVLGGVVRVLGGVVLGLDTLHGAFWLVADAINTVVAGAYMLGGNVAGMLGLEGVNQAGIEAYEKKLNRLQTRIESVGKGAKNTVDILTNWGGKDFTDKGVDSKPSIDKIGGKSGETIIKPIDYSNLTASFDNISKSMEDFNHNIAKEITKFEYEYSKLALINNPVELLQLELERIPELLEESLDDVTKKNTDILNSTKDRIEAEIAIYNEKIEYLKTVHSMGGEIDKEELSRLNNAKHMAEALLATAITNNTKLYDITYKHMRNTREYYNNLLESEKEYVKKSEELKRSDVAYEKAYRMGVISDRHLAYMNELSNLWQGFEDYKISIIRKSGEHDREGLYDILDEDLINMENRLVFMGKIMQAQYNIEGIKIALDTFKTVTDAMGQLQDALDEKARRKHEKEMARIDEKHKHELDAFRGNSKQLAQLEKKQADEKEKAQAKAQKKNKALMIAEIMGAQAMSLANVWVAVTKMMPKNPITAIAFGSAMTALTLATMGTQISNVQALKDGGIVGDKFSGASYGKDNQMVHARKGEMFINAPQQKELWNMLSGKGRMSTQPFQLNHSLVIQGSVTQDTLTQIKEQENEFMDVIERTYNKLRSYGRV